MDDAIATGGSFLANILLPDAMATALRLRGSWSRLASADYGVDALLLIAKHVMRILQPVAQQLKHLHETDMILDTSTIALEESSYLTGRVVRDWIVYILLGEYFFEIPDPNNKGSHTLHQCAVSRAALFVRWIHCVTPQARFLEDLVLAAGMIFTQAASCCELKTPLKTKEIRAILHQKCGIPLM